MTTLVLALRGAAAVAVLTVLAGGLPGLVAAGLSIAVGLWSAVIAGAALPDELLWLVAAREIVVGATIGVAAALPVLAVATAGRLVDRAAIGSRGPYRALFTVLAAAVFVGVDGHVALVSAIAASFRDVPAVVAGEPRVLTTLARLLPIAVQLAVPWLVTAAVVEIAVGVAARIAGRAGGYGPLGAATPAALVMMTASLIGTLAVAIAALVAPGR